MTLVGLPHSETHGLSPACGYPWLFAAYRVLRRLLVPRHSPCALCSLTIKIELIIQLCEFRVHCFTIKNCILLPLLLSSFIHKNIPISVFLWYFYQLTAVFLLFSFQGPRLRRANREADFTIASWSDASFGYANISVGLTHPNISGWCQR